MVIILICILLSIWVFGLYTVIHIDDFQKKFQIHQKLIKSLEEKHQDLLDDLHTL